MVRRIAAISVPMGVKSRIPETSLDGLGPDER